MGNCLSVFASKLGLQVSAQFASNNRRLQLFCGCSRLALSYFWAPEGIAAASGRMSEKFDHSSALQ
eukprot:2667067-Pyramimonas_sp.AAC.1